MRRVVTFTKAERARLADQCQALGIHFEEFVHDAAMQACDEMEGVQRSLVVESMRVAKARQELEPYRDDADVRVRSLARLTLGVLEGRL